MSKAIIRPDGWVVCEKHDKKLLYIDKDGIKLYCGKHCTDVFLDIQAVYDYWKDRNKTIDELWEEIKGEA